MRKPTRTNRLLAVEGRNGESADIGFKAAKGFDATGVAGAGLLATGTGGGVLGRGDENGGVCENVGFSHGGFSNGAPPSGIAANARDERAEVERAKVEREEVARGGASAANASHNSAPRKATAPAGDERGQEAGRRETRVIVKDETMRKFDAAKPNAFETRASDECQFLALLALVAGFAGSRGFRVAHIKTHQRAAADRRVR